VSVKEVRRQKLLKLYRNLKTSERILLQLLAVIHEPTNPSTILRCLQKSAVEPPGERTNSLSVLAPRLERLMDLKLVDSGYQVHREIIEIVCRDALVLHESFDQENLLANMEDRSSWMREASVKDRCHLCQQRLSRGALRTSSGPMCLECFEINARSVFSREDPSRWPMERVNEALSNGGDLRSRLSLLWQFRKVFPTITSQGVEDWDKTAALLVANLGHDRDNPVGRLVSDAAVEACILLGERVIPHLLAVDENSWACFAGAVRVAVALNKDRREDIDGLLERAVKHPQPEVRRQLASAVRNLSASWAVALKIALNRDRDPSVRKIAFEGYMHGVPREGSVVSTIPFSALSNSVFGRMARTVREELPSGSPHATSKTMYCHRLLRDLRIGVYFGDLTMASSAHGFLHTYCGQVLGRMEPITAICCNPFDPQWFQSQPEWLQVHVATSVSGHTVDTLEPDDDVLSYVMESDLISRVPKAMREKLLKGLCVRLILAGRIEEARKLLDRWGGEVHIAGFRGWVALLEGKIPEAVGEYEADLRELRRTTGKKGAYFADFEGVFFPLALIVLNDPEQLNRVGQLVSAAVSKAIQGSSLWGTYVCLKAIVHTLKMEPDEARECLNTVRPATPALTVFFGALAAYWLEGVLDQDRVDQLSRLFMGARRIGLHWLAMECAELLRLTEQDTPFRRKSVEKVTTEMGLRSIVASLKIEEPWKRSLKALVHAADVCREIQPETANRRLVWLLGFDEGTAGRINLQPLEQKRSVKGEWSRGRAVALARFQKGTGLEPLSPHDQALRDALVRDYVYYGQEYRFELDKLLPAMVGHPLIFLESSPQVSVEVVKGEPEILVSRAGNLLSISFSTRIPGSRYTLVEETPTRFKVIEVTDEHRRIARILGTSGLRVPSSATEDVLAAIAGISSLVTVHSSIGGTSKDVVEVEADPCPHVHLLPSGQGLRLQVYVRPFSRGGPYLKPGIGAENVLAEIEGTRLQTRRDLKVEAKMADEIEMRCSLLGGLPEVDRHWVIDNPEECLQVLLDLKSLQEEEKALVEWPEGERLRVTREVSFQHLRMRIRSRVDWFEMTGELQLDDDQVMDMKQLIELMQNSPSRFIPLGEGQFLALSQEFHRRLRDLEAFADKRGKELRIHPLASLALGGLTDRLDHLEVDDQWKNRVQSLRDAEQVVPLVPSTLKAELRDYQVEGFRWLARLASLGMGACLADDMGLGKTIQALGVILHRAGLGPTLVVAPTSVCMNWMNEGGRFTPTLNIHPFGGANREDLVRRLGPHDVLVCSYGLLQTEVELLTSVDWNTIVLDEAQAIKNMATKRSQAAMSLNGGFKLITTGTPIENHLGEFYTLFNFINPGLLGSQKRFNNRFAIPIERNGDRDVRKRLKKLIQPFILRRLKSQVLEELPPRTEVVLQVEMSPEESAFYEALRRRALEQLDQDDSPAAQKHIKILAEITKLRQAACNPRLVLPETTLSSSKLQVFGEVVDELIENKHKALVFSQFVGHLGLIREYLDARGVDYRYLDGATPPKERQHQVESFQAGRGDLFLISLKAGGLGLNLTAADYVIHMDPWWNPAVEDQASDRAHRIGQLHPVTVYRLVSRHTIEEKIVRLHQDKRDLASSLLDGSDISGRISAEELLQLIREE
jgi:superfamily II DNA or RNA helicase